MINDAVLQSAVDFIAAQGHGDSEKSEILDLAAEAISNSAVAPTGTHLVVRVSGIETMTVTRTVGIIKAIMTASSDSEVRSLECRPRHRSLECRPLSPLAPLTPCMHMCIRAGADTARSAASHPKP